MIPARLQRGDDGGTGVAGAVDHQHAHVIGRDGRHRYHTYPVSESGDRDYRSTSRHTASGTPKPTGARNGSATLRALAVLGAPRWPSGVVWN